MRKGSIRGSHPKQTGIMATIGEVGLFIILYTPNFILSTIYDYHEFGIVSRAIKTQTQPVQFFVLFIPFEQSSSPEEIRETSS